MTGQGKPATRVLLVDDNVDALQTLHVLLEMQGFEVQSFATPDEALAQASMFQPEVCVLDIGLPGMDGYELARRLQASGLRARYVALTGYGQASDRERSAAAGFHVHLTKPVQLDPLLDALKPLDA
ncbi:response regulator [Ramlibacter sp. MMS24-I3-19]|uniref:response regulator n=1 Tax=Ramlibacter sp. MMS24-I3-19 TaxID=3416606 RepID=UPI003D03A317